MELTSVGDVIEQTAIRHHLSAYYGCAWKELVKRIGLKFRHSERA
jgi:hypothetical protein